MGRIRAPARVTSIAVGSALTPDGVAPPSQELLATFGDIDIYLFDQLLRGRLDRRRRVLDAGCGDGRNSIYLLRRGFTCFAIDRDPAAIERMRARVAQLAPHLPAENFCTGDIDRLPWTDASMDAVVCSAVLHFASDLAQFDRCVAEMWRVLAPDGMLFARLASNIGLEAAVGAAGRRVRLPDGSDRFVVDEAMLLERTQRLGGELLDPIKTTNVQQRRCMTTWCVRKTAAAS
jgi:tellurite methyltransferase